MKRANGDGSIFKTNQNGHIVWIATLTIGIDAKTGAHIRRKRTRRSQREALAALDEMKLQYGIGGAAADAAEMSVTEWLNYWLQTYVKNSVQGNTYETYQCDIRKICKHPVSRVKLKNLMPGQVQTMLNDMQTTPRAASGALTTLRSACRRAVNDGILRLDPTRGISKPQYERAEIVTITADEAVLLVQADPRPSMRIAIQIGYSTGLRPNEILGLTWSCIHIDTLTLTVTHAVKTIQGNAVIGPPKNKSSYRTISIPEKLAADLKAYKRIQAAAILQEKSYKNRGLLICNEKTGEPLTIQCYSSRFHHIAQRAGISITPKGLRHTHATQLFAAGWHPKDVQERLGHSTIKMTCDIYTHYIPQRANKIAQYVNSIYPSGNT